MNEYLRILSYATGKRAFLIKFIFFSTLAGVFGVLNLVMLKPLLDILFDQNTSAVNSSGSGTGFSPLVYFQTFFVQILTEKGKLAALGFVCSLVVCCSFLGNAFRYISMRTLEKFKVNMVAKLRQSIFSHTLSLDLAFFTSERKGELISKITNDIQEVENSVASSFSAAIKEIILLIAYMVVLFYISWPLTIFSLLVIPLIGGFLGVILKKMRSDAGNTQNHLSMLLNIMDEAFGSIRIIKSFNAESYINKKFQEENTGYKNALYNYAKKREMASPFSEFIGVSMVAGLLFFGGYLIFSGNSDLQPTTFIAYLALFSQVVRPAKEISQAIGSAQRGLVAAKRVLSVLDLNQAEVVSGNSRPSFKNSITFKGLGFSYTDKQQVLNDINIKIQKGSVVALVGASGSGKSTLADLLMRFYDPKLGEINLDEENINTLDLAAFRNKIGVVPQEASLFNDSIRNNIFFGREASETELTTAINTAYASEFIDELPSGIAYNVGERGSKLSGGQKQRISIARAILKDPELLILDEATSALDTASEQQVQKALNSLLKNRTALVIAHRLSTIQSADNIYVLHQGQVIEEGNHNSLMAIENGHYKKLVELQKLA